MDTGKLFSFSIFLRVNSQSCMRNSTKSLFRNQLTGLPTNPVCFIFYAYKSSLQVLNKLHLPLRQLSCLFFGESASTLSKEEAGQLAQRQMKFIQHLQAALVRIENKTYGICRETGKLIPKERLRAVPHATLGIDAKEDGKRK